MKRKVIQIAKSTQLVSLPRKWAIKQNIKKGDEIDVEEDGTRLIISSKANTSKSMKISINLEGFEEIIPKIMHGLYKNGYDEIEILYKNSKTISKLQKSLRYETIGYEIVEQYPTRCVIKTIAGTHSSEFNIVLRRTFILFKLMLEGIIDSLEKEDNTQIPDLKLHELTNNKYTGFCRRIINKFGIESSFPAVEYCIVEWLERVADEAKYLCDYILEDKNNIKVNKETLQLYKKLLNLFNVCYELHYNFDMDKMKEAALERKKILKETLPLFSSSKPKRHVHYIISMTQIIADLIGFEMQLAFAKKNQE